MSEYVVSEVPECCDKCFCQNRCQSYKDQLVKMQSSDHEQIFDIFGEMRLNGCLFKELPPHGDLIDKTQISYGYDPHFGGRVIATPEMIDSVPVIIGASK